MTLQYKVHYRLKAFFPLIQYSYTQIQLQKEIGAGQNARQVGDS